MPASSDWALFPDPRAGGLLTAPIGPGCYELRLGDQLVCFGIGKNVAHRLTSLLPSPLGAGTRKHCGKRAYVLAHLGRIEYRTIACATRDEAAGIEREMKARGGYLFGT